MKTLKDANVNNKKVIVRVDFNVPIKDLKIEDDNRIIQSLKTINYLIDKNAKIILLSHLSRIKDEKDKKDKSLKIVYDRLKELVNTNVYFCKETRGKELEEKVRDLNSGEILLIENTRFEDVNGNKESSCDEELSKYWASLGDVFVLDAFASSHRAHASTYGIGKYLPSYIGLLIEEELNVLNEIINNKNKTIVLGGAKVEDKIGVVNNLINSSNKILICGVMPFTFLKVLGYEVGPNFVDETKLEDIKKLYSNYKNKIILPLDFVSPSGMMKITEINDYGYDVGRETIENMKKELSNSSLVVWNGPLGKFEDEKYETGTKEILEYLCKNNIKTVISGGDTGNAVHKYNLNMFYVSTGGGATLEYLSGKEFKSLENMK